MGRNSRESSMKVRGSETPFPRSFALVIEKRQVAEEPFQTSASDCGDSVREAKKAEVTRAEAVQRNCASKRTR